MNSGALSLIFVSFQPSLPVSKAIEAAYVQSGWQNQETLFKDYGTRRTEQYAKELGIYQPLSLAMMGAGIYRDRAVSFKLLSARFSVKQDRFLVEVPF